MQRLRVGCGALLTPRLPCVLPWPAPQADRPIYAPQAVLPLYARTSGMDSRFGHVVSATSRRGAFAAKRSAAFVRSNTIADHAAAAVAAAAAAHTSLQLSPQQSDELEAQPTAQVPGPHRLVQPYILLCASNCFPAAERVYMRDRRVPAAVVGYW